MWIIPGVDMGDCPSKSRGDINHLAEADAEFAPGCLSLDGEIGQTERKTGPGTFLPTQFCPDVHDCGQSVGKMTVFFVVLRIPSEGC